MRLLHIDSSVMGDESISRKLSAAIVRKCIEEVPDIEVQYRDLGVDPIPHITREYYKTQFGAIPESGSELESAVREGQAQLEEFLNADAYVIGLPMYNWAIPSNFKSWIDRLCVVGRAFNMTPNGYVGLVPNRPMIVASSRGGFYSVGHRYAFLDHQETYVEHVFGVFGIRNLKFVRAEGVGISEAVRSASVADAMRQALEDTHILEYLGSSKASDAAGQAVRHACEAGGGR